MEFTSAEAQQRYAELATAAGRTVVGLDFDGVLAPIVADPERSRIHPEAAEVLTGLADRVRAVAVITGRPAQVAIRLGDLDRIGAGFAERGSELFVFGQYGNERWSSRARRIESPEPPEGLAAFERALPGLLAGADAADAFVEQKGLSVAVHTRRLADPEGARARLLSPMRELAEAQGLAVEPGRNVVEVRAPGMDKGGAVRVLVEELDAGGFLFAGDDLGDLAAYDAVERLRAEGMPTLLVCVLSEEEQALAARADVVVDGPDGVLDLLRRLATDALPTS